jgi:hypothetical protein
VLVLNRSGALAWEFRQKTNAMVRVGTLDSGVFVAQETEWRLNRGAVLLEGFELLRVGFPQTLGIAFAYGFDNGQTYGIWEDDCHFFEERQIP